VNALFNVDALAETSVNTQGVVDQLRAIRAAAQRRRYRGGAPELPNRAKTIAIVDSVVSALYPRHFGPQGLSAQGVDDFVAESLRSAARALRGQVRLELALEDAGVGPRTNQMRSADAIVADFVAGLPEVRTLVDGDVRAGFEGDPSATSIDEIVFSFPGIAAILRHRLAHRLHRLGAPMLARIIAEDSHSRTGIDIHPGAEIGERFFIDHGTGVVIGATAVIGRNVRIYQAVTLGAKRFEVDPTTGALRKNYPRHPIVEDDVVIYAGATILGRVNIGKGSSIGGNVWMTQDVPAGSAVSQARPRNEIYVNGGGI
jgi:serine O-acetyltransferase